MLTCCTLCRRPLRGRIVESKNIPHIDVGSSCPARAIHLRVGDARVKWSRAVAAALCSGHATRAWRRCAARLIFRLLHAHGAVQHAFLAWYVLHDVHGSGPSQNSRYNLYQALSFMRSVLVCVRFVV
jgi:hypothetical protein